MLLLLLLAASVSFFIFFFLSLVFSFHLLFPHVLVGLLRLVVLISSSSSCSCWSPSCCGSRSVFFFFFASLLLWLLLLSLLLLLLPLPAVAVQDSAARSHRQLSRAIKRFDDGLQEFLGPQKVWAFDGLCSDSNLKGQKREQKMRVLARLVDLVLSSASSGSKPAPARQGNGARRGFFFSQVESQ